MPNHHEESKSNCAFGSPTAKSVMDDACRAKAIIMAADDPEPKSDDISFDWTVGIFNVLVDEIPKPRSKTFDEIGPSSK